MEEAYKCCLPYLVRNQFRKKFKNYIANIYLSCYIKSRPHRAGQQVKKRNKKVVDTTM